MKVYLIISSLAVITVPLSVTGSQSFMALSLLVGIWLQIYWKWKGGHPAKSGTKSYVHRFTIYSGLMLFAYLALVYLIRTLDYSLGFSHYSSLFDPRPYHNELTDFFLYLFALLILFGLLRFFESGQIHQNFSGMERAKSWILLVLSVFAVLTIVSGLLAVFSEVRLSKLFTGYGNEFHAGNRPQFVFRSFGEFTLYRPIGFMNTRLSYAGILLFALPILMHRFFSDLPGLLKWRSPVAWTALIWGGLTLVGVVLLAMNGSRSGQLGALVNLFLVFLLHARGWIRADHGKSPVSTAEKQPSNLVTRFLPASWNVSLRTMRIVPSTMALLCFLLAGLLYLHLLQSGTHRHTDFMRPLIWKGSMAIFQEFPLLGIGPGNFPEVFHSWARGFYLEYPRTMYFLEITPDSHAHNDLLHLLVLGGLPAGLIFLGLIYASTASLLQCWKDARPPAHPSGESALDLEWTLRATIPGFLLAGLSQCYFQDDEVVVVFWIFLFSAEALRVIRSRLPA